jgi:hypothetical protein
VSSEPPVELFRSPPCTDARPPVLVKLYEPIRDEFNVAAQLKSPNVVDRHPELVFAVPTDVEPQPDALLL